MTFKEHFNLWEAKQRLDPKCWTGYRKDGTKMKGGKRVNNCVKENLTEDYKLSSSFSDLPPSAPHGFWVTKDGKFVVVPRMYGHDEALQQIIPDELKGAIGMKALDIALKLGMMRVAKTGGSYEITYHPLYMKGTAAKKTAKDIAAFYRMGIIDNFDFYEENFADGKNSPGKIKLSTDPKRLGAYVGDYKATGPVVDIPANQLVGFEPDDKMTQPESKANVEKIVARLKNGDTLPPLLVRKYKDGYQVVDGHHRFWAYKLVGVKSIPAYLVPAEDIEEVGRPDVTENFADGKNPQDKGDAERYGINTKASVSSLRNTAKQGGRKGQLAHWMANMKAGKAKKK